MAAIETQVSNSYESTLSASLGAGDTTINVTSTAQTPGVPFYVVIDPGDDSKREVVLVDQGKTGTTLTLSAASSRGQDGTTDVDHDANAVIGIFPIAAHWRDIHDRVDEHTHTGGADGTVIATSDLSGHDKAAHDALGIDADTVDGSHAAALLDRANHTGTQLTSTISDHTTAHDAIDHGPVAGDIIVSAEAEDTTTLGLTGSQQTMASSTIDIPAGWSSYSVQLSSILEVEAGTPGASRQVNILHKYAGVNRGPNPSPRIFANDKMVFPHLSHVSGLSTTGTVAFELTAALNANDDYSKVLAQMTVLAMRTS